MLDYRSEYYGMVAAILILAGLTVISAVVAGSCHRRAKFLRDKQGRPGPHLVKFILLHYDLAKNLVQEVKIFLLLKNWSTTMKSSQCSFYLVNRGKGLVGANAPFHTMQLF